MRLCQCPSLPIIASLKDEASNGSPHSFAIVNELDQDVARGGDFSRQILPQFPQSASSLLKYSSRTPDSSLSASLLDRLNLFQPTQRPNVLLTSQL
jgi:hypothetical protein